MASSMHRLSQSPPCPVNLHCSQCNGQIGIFDNEWTRFTTSYVRSVHPGAHFGTEVAMNKAQVVPEGTTQRSLEGCTLAEVFCTKCSGVVGQYCKGIPGPERRHMLKQYLYKLSKTHLKNTDTGEIVEPVFGYGGDPLPPSARASVTPRPSVPAVPQWSYPPSQQQDPSSRLQPMTDPNRRISAHVSSQTYREPTPQARPSYETAELLSTLQSDAQARDQGADLLEERWATFDTRMEANENQLRAISSVLDTFRGTLEGIQASITALQTQSSTPRVGNPLAVDFVNTLESTIAAMRTAQSNAEELEELRAENESLKAKWDIVQSAMATATGTIAPNSSGLARRNNLGKRKRDNGIVETTPVEPVDHASRRRSLWLGDLASSIQVPTPQSSTYSDLQSQDELLNSRPPTPENPPAESTELSLRGVRKPKTRSTRAPPVPAPVQPSKKQRRSEVSQLTEVPGPSAQFAFRDETESVTRPSTGVSDVQGKENRAPSQSTDNTLDSFEQDVDPQISTPADTLTRKSNQERQPVEPEAPLLPDYEAPILDDENEHQMDVEPAEATKIPHPTGETVEFSVDEEDPPASSGVPTTEQPQEPELRAATGGSHADTEMVEPTKSRESSPDDASTKSAPSRRTRSRTKAASTADRRKTTSFDYVQERSLAPEPALPASRKILHRRVNKNKSGVFEHSTPESIEAELIELEKPRGQRQPKVIKQTTTKILNEELMELGLEEWIDKDKNTPEYKVLVEEARARKREQNRLLALASRGVAVAGVDMEMPSLQSAPSLDEAFQQAQALADVTNERALPATIPAKTALAALRAAGGRKLTKEEREQEIRRRDELAKAAMDMDD